MRQPGSALRTAATCSLSSAASASPLPFAARIFATTVSTSAIGVSLPPAPSRAGLMGSATSHSILLAPRVEPQQLAGDGGSLEPGAGEDQGRALGGPDAAAGEQPREPGGGGGGGGLDVEPAAREGA